MKTKFGKLEMKNGRLIETSVQAIDLSKVKSDDPLAYAYGLVQGERGNPLGKAPKGDKFAPEYIRGWKEGHKKSKLKRLT